MTKPTLTCQWRVADCTGFHWFRCDRPSKFETIEGYHLCGTHNNSYIRRIKNGLNCKLQCKGVLG